MQSFASLNEPSHVALPDKKPLVIRFHRLVTHRLARSAGILFPWLAPVTGIPALQPTSIRLATDGRLQPLQGTLRFLG